MRLNLSKSEMLELWRQRAGLKLLRTDCSVERTDGVDVDAMLERQMRSWYLKLLDHGPLEHLAPVDVADSLQMVTDEHGVGRATLPQGARRLLTLDMAPWQKPAIIISHTDDRWRRLLRMQLNPYSQASTETPVAVTDGCGGLLVYPSLPGTSVTEALVAMDTGPDQYCFDDSAL